MPMQSRLAGSAALAPDFDSVVEGAARKQASPSAGLCVHKGQILRDGKHHAVVASQRVHARELGPAPDLDRFVVGSAVN